MAELPNLTNWKCNITMEGMPFDDVEILQVSNVGVLVNDDGKEKFIPWSAITAITKIGENKLTAKDV